MRGETVKKILAALSCLAVWGCTSIGESDDLSQLSDVELCTQAKPKAGWLDLWSKRRLEAEKRGLIERREWRWVEDKKVYTGMSECGIVSAFGIPKDDQIANRPYVFGGENKIVYTETIQKSGFYGGVPVKRTYRDVPRYAITLKDRKVETCTVYEFQEDNGKASVKPRRC